MNIPRKLIIVIFCIVVLMTPLSAWLKMSHSPLAGVLMEFTLIFLAILIILSLTSLIKSEVLSSSEKWMYGLAIVFFPVIGVLFYLLNDRRKISKEV